VAKPHRDRTERLRLRPLQAGDRADLHHLFVDPDVRRYLWDDQSSPRADLGVVAESLRRFPTTAPASGRSSCAQGARAGMVASRLLALQRAAAPEILFGLAPVYWGGPGDRARPRLLRYGFEELGLEHVDGSADAPNNASLR